MGAPVVRVAALWVIAALLAVGASTTAVRLAADSVQAPAALPVPSPASDGGGATPSADTGGMATSPSPDATPTLTSPPSASPTTDDGAEAGTTTPTSRPSPSPRAGATDEPGPSPAPSPQDDGTPDAEPSEDDGGSHDGSSSDGAGSGAVTERTATSTGGNARFRFVGDDVELVWTAPAQGFSVEVERSDGEVRVTFTSAGHESRIDADVEDGAPRIRVREDAEDD